MFAYSDPKVLIFEEYLGYMKKYMFVDVLILQIFDTWEQIIQNIHVLKAFYNTHICPIEPCKIEQCEIMQCAKLGVEVKHTVISTVLLFHEYNKTLNLLQKYGNHKVFSTFMKCKCASPSENAFFYVANLYIL